MPDMEDEIENKSDARQEVPSVKRTREWYLNWFSANPVQDSRHQHVQRDEREEQVRGRKAEAPLRKRPNAREVGHHPGNGPPPLQQMHDHQSDERETDVSMNRVPYIQDGQRGERTSSAQQEPEVNERARP